MDEAYFGVVAQDRMFADISAQRRETERQAAEIHQEYGQDISVFLAIFASAQCVLGTHLVNFFNFR
jgi:hypothetical protein